MKVLDAGHRYLLDSVDGEHQQELQFVKREGDGYPGNVGHYPGTLIQDVLRCLLDRVRYVDNQIPSEWNLIVRGNLEDALFALEARAAERHGKRLDATQIGIDTHEVKSASGHLEQFWEAKQ